MIAPFTSAIPELVRQRLQSRRDKLTKDQGLAASLGYPVRRREGAPETYAVPTVRRKVPAARPPVAGGARKPEPTLTMEEYEHILSVVSNMVVVMERSPQAFAGMKEEDLRQHFLVQLNGQYEGQATGETFNQPVKGARLANSSTPRTRSAVELVRNIRNMTGGRGHLGRPYPSCP